MDWIRTNKSFIYKTTLIFFFISIFTFSLYALFTSLDTRTLCIGIRNHESTSGGGGRKGADCYFQVINNPSEEDKNRLSATSILRRHFLLASIRRFLSVPGSSPPRCTSKCGKCTPCKPVHVPVPPGTPVTTEYYPEAWRCKCGNKYYMP